MLLRFCLCGCAFASTFALAGCGILLDDFSSDGYNYNRFSVEYYDHVSLPGPWAGQAATDMTLTDKLGNRVRLSDFRGKFIVLETASITCPAYRQHVKPMNELAQKYADAEDLVFLVLYVREAHPGGRIGQHVSFEQKLELAQRFETRVPDERRMLLVDDLQGTAHRAYGSMPNMAYVISPDFLVLFRSDWTHVTMIDDILSRRHELPTIDAEHHDPGSSSLIASIAVLLEAGPRAIIDVIRSSGDMSAAWRRADEYYAVHGTLRRSALPNK